jgi:3' exoribonuclease family, domain 2
LRLIHCGFQKFSETFKPFLKIFRTVFCDYDTHQPGVKIFFWLKKSKEERIMKNKFMRFALGTIFGLLMLIGSAQLLVSGQEKETQERSRRSLVGTWQTLVTPRNCATGVPVAPAFPGILTFNKGGTLTGTSTAVSSVYGVWEHENGWQDYSLAFLSLRHSPTGTFIGTQKVRQTVEISSDGNSFTSTGTVGMLAKNPLLDLCYEEDSEADVDMNIVCTGGGKLIEIQGTAEQEPFDRDQMNQMLDLAEKGINQLFTIQRYAINK